MNANLRKYLKYKQKYLDLKSEFEGGGPGDLAIGNNTLGTYRPNAVQTVQPSGWDTLSNMAHRRDSNYQIPKKQQQPEKTTGWDFLNLLGRKQPEAVPQHNNNVDSIKLNGDVLERPKYSNEGRDRVHQDEQFNWDRFEEPKKPMNGKRANSIGGPSKQNWDYNKEPSNGKKRSNGQKLDNASDPDIVALEVLGAAATAKAAKATRGFGFGIGKAFGFGKKSGQSGQSGQPGQSGHIRNTVLTQQEKELLVNKLKRTITRIGELYLSSNNQELDQIIQQLLILEDEFLKENSNIIHDYSHDYSSDKEMQQLSEEEQRETINNKFDDFLENKINQLHYLYYNNKPEFNKLAKTLSTYPQIVEYLENSHFI